MVKVRKCPEGRKGVDVWRVKTSNCKDGRRDASEDGRWYPVRLNDTSSEREC